MWPAMVYALVIALAPVPGPQPAADVRVVETFDTRIDCLATAQAVESENWGRVVARCLPIKKSVDA